MTDVLEEVNEEIRELAEPLVAKREEVLAHRRSLIEERERSDQALARIERVLKPLRPDLFETKLRPKTSSGSRIGTRTASGTATGTGITVEGCEPYVKEIERQFADGAEYVTQIGVYQKIKGGDQAKSSAAFKYLRKINFLRKGGIKDRRETWYIDHADAYTKALEEVNVNG